MSTRIVTNRANVSPERSETPADQMSAFFMDLEGLINRIESATTYYQILGVDRSAGQEGVKSAYERVLRVLYPPYAVARTLPSEVIPKIDRVFNKASQAFAVLASFERRRQYDRTLLSLSGKPEVGDASRQSKKLEPQGPSSSAKPGDGLPSRSEKHEISINPRQQHGEVYMESSIASPSDNRRRCDRFKLAIPVRITGHDAQTGKWHEMAETLDVSRTGLRIRMRRRVKDNTVLYLTLPMPAKLRSHGFAGQSYNVYGLVRTVEPPRQGIRTVGVEFLGEHPPAGYLDKPWAVFRAKRTGNAERRRSPREKKNELVKVEYYDETMHSILRDQARMENVSRNGLRIAGTKAPPDFDLVLISCARIKFEGFAALRNRYVGKDGFERLCLQLIDKEWPL